MFFERGGHEFIAPENTLPGNLQLRMIHRVDPVHKFEFPKLEQPGPPIFKKMVAVPTLHLEWRAAGTPAGRFTFPVWAARTL